MYFHYFHLQRMNAKDTMMKSKTRNFFSQTNDEVERRLTASVYNNLPFTAGSRVLTDTNQSGASLPVQTTTQPRSLQTETWPAAIPNFFLYWKNSGVMFPAGVKNVEALIRFETKTE